MLGPTHSRKTEGGSDQMTLVTRPSVELSTNGATETNHAEAKKREEAQKRSWRKIEMNWMALSLSGNTKVTKVEMKT